VLLGYEEGRKAYRLYDPKRAMVVIFRDVVFDEMAAWDWVQQGTGEVGGVSSTFTIEHLVIQGGGGGAEKQVAAAGERTTAREQFPPASAHSPPPQSPTTAGQETPPLESASPPTDIDKYVDAFHDGEEVQFGWVDNIIGEGRAPRLTSRLQDELLFVSAEEPPMFTMAEHDANWRWALLEMRVTEDNGTWELVDPPAGCRPIGLNWVYKVKWDERGAIVKYKAQFVVCGFVQREGINFEDVFAPVA
jgi:hypothetical protein